LLDKDLVEDAPGWYSDRGFNIPNEKSVANEEDHEKDFLHLLKEPKQPKVGQEVCLRIVLIPLRCGYQCWSSPTDEELGQSGLELFGKGCPCSNPDCPFKNGTCEYFVVPFGAVNGREVTATGSLGSGSEYANRKLTRFVTLRDFFGVEVPLSADAFSTMIRFIERESKWKVVNIHASEQELIHRMGRRASWQTVW